MVEVYCTHRIPDKNKKSTYRLVDSFGNVKCMSSKELKVLINNNKIQCRNLYITSNNKLRVVSGFEHLMNTYLLECYVVYNINKHWLEQKLDIRLEKINNKYHIVLKKAIPDKNGILTIPDFITALDMDKSDNIKGRKIFNHCKALKVIWERPIQIDLSMMFYGCDKIEYLDVSKINMKNIQYAMGMFSGCSQLKNINVNGWDVRNVINISCMFENCKSLNGLDLSTLKFNKLELSHSMFKGCISLEDIKINDAYLYNLYKTTGNVGKHNPRLIRPKEIAY